MSLNDIRRDVDKRIEEIKTGLKDKGPEAAKSVEASLDSLRAEIEDRLEEFHDSIDDKLEYGRREIKKQPLMAVGIAVLVGVVVGMLFGNKSKE